MVLCAAAAASGTFGVGARFGVSYAASTVAVTRAYSAATVRLAMCGERRVMSSDRCPSSAAIAVERHATVDGLGGQGVSEAGAGEMGATPARQATKTEHARHGVAAIGTPASGEQAPGRAAARVVACHCVMSSTSSGCRGM